MNAVRSFPAAILLYLFTGHATFVLIIADPKIGQIDLQLSSPYVQGNIAGWEIPV
ncbi:MAG: hypothetical protein JJE34_10905 [Alphaproteobacteria bacterium]|nr:hypothetical protein [Alphaproteobacteria bacterium]